MRDRVHHVAIQVHDIGEAVAWYRGRFRCEVAWQDDTWALLRFDNVALALVLPGEHPPHVGISRTDASRFGRLTRHRDGTASVYVRDPAGNAVEILDAATLTEAP